MDSVLGFCADAFLLVFGVISMLTLLGLFGWAACYIWLEFRKWLRTVLREEVERNKNNG